MNQPFMTRKLLPPLAEGLGALPLLLLPSFFSPSTCTNSLLTCCNKCLRNSLLLVFFFFYCQRWYGWGDKVWVYLAAKQALPVWKTAGRKHSKCVFFFFVAESLEVLPSVLQINTVWNKADCKTSHEWSVFGRQPPEVFCSLLHLCLMPRVRFPFLSKSFTERDKSRPAGGPPKEGDTERGEKKGGERSTSGAICRIQWGHLIRQSERQDTVLAERVCAQTRKNKPTLRQATLYEYCRYSWLVCRHRLNYIKLP